MNRCLVACFFSCFIAMSAALAGDAPAPVGAAAVPQPLDLGTDEIAAFVAAPNPLTLLDNAEAIAKEFAPDKIQPGMLKALTGLALGDPLLANLNAGPVVVMLFKSPPVQPPVEAPPPFAFFIPAKAAAPFDAALGGHGLQTAFQDGVLLAALTPDALDKAKLQTAAYRKIADAALTSDVRIYVNVASLMDTYGALLKTKADEAAQQVEILAPPPPGMANAADIAKVLKLEMKAGIEFLNETTAVQFDLKLNPDQVQIETIYAAKDNALIAGLLNGAPAEKHPNLYALINPSVMTGAFRYDPAAMAAFIDKLSATLAKDPDFAEYLTDDAAAMIKQGWAAFDGETVFSMNIDKDGVFRQQFAAAVADEKKYPAFLDLIASWTQPKGAISGLYDSLGIKMTSNLERAARQHAGVDVNRMKMNMDTKDLPAMQAEMFKKMVLDMDLALANGLSLMANSPEALDAMIDHALKGDTAKKEAVLQSAKVFGDGRQIYVDYDFIAMFKAMMGMNEFNPLKPIFEKLQASQPVLFAANSTNGRALLQTQIPLAPFIEITKAVQNEPPPPPPPPPEKAAGVF